MTWEQLDGDLSLTLRQISWNWQSVGFFFHPLAQHGKVTAETARKMKDKSV